MNDVKVSVIMPVYNVENYVGRAIESIQNQTLTDWEFFAVDDGTPDNSGKICDEYAAKDPRIKVIHKENGGAPSARNVAIDKAVGKYMYFMDSDDWAEKTMLQDMVDLAEKNDLQLVVSGYYIECTFLHKLLLKMQHFYELQMDVQFLRSIHENHFLPIYKLYLWRYLHRLLQ